MSSLKILTQRSLRVLFLQRNDIATQPAQSDVWIGNTRNYLQFQDVTKITTWAHIFCGLYKQNIVWLGEYIGFSLLINKDDKFTLCQVGTHFSVAQKRFGSNPLLQVVLNAKQGTSILQTSHNKYKSHIILHYIPTSTPTTSASEVICLLTTRYCQGTPGILINLKHTLFLLQREREILWTYFK